MAQAELMTWGDCERARRVCRRVAGWVGAALVAGCLTACGGADGTDSAGDPSASPSPSADPPAASASPTPAEPSSETLPYALLPVLTTLSESATFASGPSDLEVAALEFVGAGGDFSPTGLAAGLPADCTRLDLALLSEVIGIPVTVPPLDYGFIRAADGYLSCAIQSAADPDLALAYVHFAPDLAGVDGNWA